MHPAPVWAREPRIKPNYSHKKYLSFPRNIPNSMKKVLLYTNVTENNMLSAKQSYLSSQESTSRKTSDLHRRAFLVRQIMQEMQLEALGLKNTSLLPRHIVEENRHLAMFHNLFYMGGKDLPMHQHLDRFFIKSLQNARENDKVVKGSKAGAGGPDAELEAVFKLPEVSGRARADQWGVQKVPQCVPERDLVHEMPAKPTPRNVHTSLAVNKSHHRRDMRGFENERSHTLPTIILGKGNNEPKPHVQFTEEGRENMILPNFPVRNRGKAARFRREKTFTEDGRQDDNELDKKESGNRRSPSFVMFKDLSSRDSDSLVLQDGYMFHTQAEDGGRVSIEQLLTDNRHWVVEQNDESDNKQSSLQKP